MHRYKNFLMRTALRRLSTTDATDHSALANRVLSLVKKYDRIDAAKVTEKADFQKDLGLDSLDRVELVMALEQEFSVEIPEEKADKLMCCSDVVDFLEKNSSA